MTGPRFPKPFFVKRTGNWLVQFGKKQHSLGANKAKAFAKYKQLVIQQGLREPGTTTTLHELIDRYWEWIQVNLAASTSERRRPILQRMKKFFPAKLQAEELKPFQVEDWLTQTLQKKNGSPTTKRDRIGLVSMMFNWGDRQGLVSKNPVARMDRPAPRMREVFVPPEQIPDVLAAVACPRLLDFVSFILDCGARPQEVFKIEAKYFKERRITFPVTKSKGRKRQRVIYLPDKSLAIVQRLVVEHRHGPIFYNSRGKPWGRESIKNAFARLREKTGIEGLCATALRHSFCHYRITSGQEMAVVSKLMGHVDGRMVAQRYSHLEGSDFLGEQANAVPLPPVKEADGSGTGAT